MISTSYKSLIQAIVDYVRNQTDFSALVLLDHPAKEHRGRVYASTFSVHSPEPGVIEILSRRDWKPQEDSLPLSVPWIILSRRLRKLPQAQIAGIVLHEVGHVLTGTQQGENLSPAEVEALADEKMAELGIPILYSGPQKLETVPDQVLNRILKGS